ncbi:AAA family ATPase [Mycoplasmopsis sturni]|uniref:AAA family ATPase n=1 Tax=Mycoplasmopsis sturni TaxID=39047 RepID=UPI00055FCAFC|nr:AAA family ATPase [Mycoplasmopsis sturni]
MKNLNDIKIIFLAGMSESGKSTVGMFLEKELNYKRIKIIQIEKVLLENLGFPISEKTSKEEFNDLLIYLHSQKDTYSNFLKIIYALSKSKNIVLESLYRSDLFIQIQKLHPKTFCLYLEADKEKRIAREFNKIKKNQQISFEEMQKTFEQKENFKQKHNAHLVKDVATHIVNNNDNLNNLLAKIKEIEAKL